MKYYTFHIGDYRKDTMHLTPLEHGIYRMLLDTYFELEQPLCGDDAKLMRSHCVRTESEQKAYKNVINDFFCKENDRYRHRGADERLEEIYKKSDKARASANARWEKNNPDKCETNANAAESNASVVRDECERIGNALESDAVGMLPITHNPIPNRNTRIPYQEILDIYHEILPELPRVNIYTDARKAKVKKVWSNNDRHKDLDFYRRYFNYVKTSNFLMGCVERKDAKPFNANFEWLMNINNLAKVTEGNYHGDA